MDKVYSYELKSDKDNLVELEIKITPKKFTEKKEVAYKRMAPSVKLSGFRPGKAPKAMIETRLGPDLYERALQDLLPEITLAVLEDASLDPLTRIEYEVKKVSEADGVEYTATFTKYPEIKLPDFKEIKVETESSDVEEKEIDAEVDRILKIYNQQQKAEAKSEETKSEKENTSEEVAEDNKEEAEVGEITEFTDEIVGTLGLGIKTVNELKEMIKKQLVEQKAARAETKKMQDIVSKAVELAKIEAPKKLIEEQTERKEQDYVTRIEQIGLKIDDFLKTQNTSIEDLRKNWEQESAEMLKSDLLLYAIIRDQNLTIDSKEIDSELNMINDIELKKQYQTIEGRRYMANVMLQQKALLWLQNEIEPKQDAEKE